MIDEHWHICIVCEDKYAETDNLNCGLGDHEYGYCGDFSGNPNYEGRCKTDAWDIRTYADTGEVLVTHGQAEYWFDVGFSQEKKNMRSLIRLVSELAKREVKVWHVQA